MGRDFELKKAITNWVFYNIDMFNIINNCVDEFRNYIYDDNGEYLIGGEEVYKFIVDIIKIIK